VTKFRHIPTTGRVIIVAVAVAVFAVAVTACATSYNAIYHLVDSLGLYGAWVTRAFPGLVDVTFLIGESAAILGGIMQGVTRSDEVTRGWPFTLMWLCVLATIAFNEAHAYLLGGRGDPKTVARCVVALLPPLLMMVSFQVLIAIVKWVMLHLGRPLNSAAVLSPTAAVGVLPAAAYAPGAYGEVAAAQPGWSPWPQNPQNGHAGVAGNGGAAPAEVTKRQQVEAYLAALPDDHRSALLALGPRAAAREVTAALDGRGVPVNERWVQRILDDHVPARRGSGTPRRGKGRR